MDTLTAVVIRSDTRRTGHFECSDPMINQIYSYAVWTQTAYLMALKCGLLDDKQASRAGLWGAERSNHNLGAWNRWITATVTLPVTDVGNVMLDGDPIALRQELAKAAKGEAFQIKVGQYTFSWPNE